MKRFTLMESEIEEVMKNTGMQRMQAYRHVQARKDLEYMRSRAKKYAAFAAGGLTDLTGKVIKEEVK